MASGCDGPQGEWALNLSFCLEEVTVVSAPQADTPSRGCPGEEDRGGRRRSWPSVTSLSSCLSTTVPKVRSLDLSTSLKHSLWLPLASSLLSPLVLKLWGSDKFCLQRNKLRPNSGQPQKQNTSVGILWFSLGLRKSLKS